MNILITGTSSGFGKEMAIALAEAGHHVHAAMRSMDGRNRKVVEGFSSLSETLPGSIQPVELNVGADDTVDRGVQAVLDALTGNLDVVVNNAGIYMGGLNETLSSAQVQHMLNVNVLGPLRIMRAVLPTLRRQGRGTLISITSSVSRLVLPLSGLYSASKAAMESVAESYAYELAPLGIESLIVQPGAFDTGIMGKVSHPDDAERRAGYGPTMALGETMSRQMMELVGPNFTHSSPRTVAEAVVDLLDLPYGQRPLRTVVDPSELGKWVRTLNTDIAQSQLAFMHTLEGGQFTQLTESA